MENSIVLSLVIPVYNEEKNLPLTLPRLAKWLADGKGKREVVFSDDGSTDQSAELIKACAEHHNGMRLVSAPHNQGKGGAVRNGMLSAEGKYRVFTDCDLAYGLDAITRIEERLSAGRVDAVIGSRALHPNGYRGYGIFRRIMSKAYLELLKVAAGLTQTDSQCGIKGFTAKAATEIFSRCEINGFAFDLEVLTVAKQLGMKTAEIPVCIVNHTDATSKVNPVKDTVRMLRDVRQIKSIHKATK